MDIQIQSGKNTVKDVIDTPIFDEDKMKDIIRQVGLNVKKYRLQKGYSISELAVLSNVDRVHLYTIEKGKNKNFRVDTLVKLALALNVTLDSLLSLESYIRRKELFLMGEIIDAMLNDCDMVTKHMILNKFGSFVDLSMLQDREKEIE